MDLTPTIDQFQVALLIAFHYLVPKLALGLLLGFLLLKTVATRTSKGVYNDVARFSNRRFTIDFVARRVRPNG
jgi:cytochrome bd-type quinol oxidase subunit 1